VSCPVPILALVALLSLAAAPGRAASPEADATRELVQAQKEAQRVFRASVRSASGEAIAAIAAAEQALASGALDANATGNALFLALRLFQASAQDALEAASSEQASSAAQSLNSLAATLDGHFPEAFYPTAGSPAISFEEALGRELDKTYAKLRKRLARTVRRFEAADFSLSFRIRAPERFTPRAWKENLVTLYADQGIETRIDLIVGWSDLGAEDDVQLRVAGGAGTENVGVVGVLTGLPSASEEAVPVDGRFSATFAQTLLSEGVWLVFAGTLSGDQSQLPFGVR
jgi:hypothetical protein